MQDTPLTAKEFIVNESWLLEKDGKKLATINKATNGYILNHKKGRSHFKNFVDMENVFQTTIILESLSSYDNSHTVCDYPVNSEIFDGGWDVHLKLPTFKKQRWSHKTFCAGYYAIKRNDNWSTELCPLSKTLIKYDMKGPFKTELEAKHAISIFES